MSGRLMEMVIEAAGINTTCKMVLLAYVHHAKESDPVAWPGQARLEKMTGLDERTIRKWVAWLKDPQHQLLIPAGYRHHVPAYRINVPLLASIEKVKPESGAGFEEEPAPGAGFTEEKPESGAGLGDNEARKPESGAGFEAGEKRKPESSAAKPESGAAKPDSGAAKPAPESPKQGRTRKEPGINQEEEEESAATPAIIDARQAERIFTEVTGMVSIPGGLDEQELILGKIYSLADQHGSQTTDYLRPFYLAQIHTTNRSGRAYSKTKHFWLTEWAIAGELPDYVKQQLRSKFKSLPPALVEWMLERDRAQAGITTGPGSNGNGKGNDPLHVYGEDIARAAEELGLVKRKGANA